MTANIPSRSAGLISITPLLTHTLLAVLSRLLTYPFLTIRAPTLFNDILNTAIRSLLSRLTIAQSRYLNAPTTTRYLTHCASHAISPQTLEVNSSHGKVETHWLGTPDAEAVILYFHGGAYTQPASAGHFAYLSQLVQDLNSPTGNSVKSNCRYRSLSILVLAYSLAPEATHPTQLAQASAVLSHLTKTRSASSIFLSGDSAGGNLALGLLTHVLHPHPAVSVVKLKEPLAGVLVYSPWAGFSTRYKSYESNETLDMLAPVALRKWSAMFLGQVSPKDAEADPGHVSGDEWTDVVRNDAEWWEGLHSVVDGVFVAYGGNEVLRDPIRELEGKVRSGWVDGGGEGERIVFLEARGEAHVQPIVDFMTPGKGKSETQRATEEWYMARLRM